MNESPWVNEKLASEKLGVSEDTLRSWREIGYLKPGTHWRSSRPIISIPWDREFIYHLPWCREEMEYWRSHHAPIRDIAA